MNLSIIFSYRITVGFISNRRNVYNREVILKVIKKFIPLLVFFLLSSCSSLVDKNKPNPLYDDICNKLKFLNFCDEIPYVEEIEIYDIEKLDLKNNECNLIYLEEKIEAKTQQNNELTYEEKISFYSSFETSCLKEIIEYSDKTYLKKYSFCCSFFNTKNSGQKSFSYFATHKENVVLSLGSGEISYFSYQDLLLDLPINVSHIKSNFREVVIDEEIYNPGWFSVKDIFIEDDLLLISYTKEVDENCYNTSILRANFNYDFLEFTEFFTDDECIYTSNKPSFSGHSSGGKISSYGNDNYILTTGEFLSRQRAQDKSSILGKTLVIDKNGKKVKNASIGHRNPQGLVYSGIENKFLLTEHGPLGGDEINVIDASKEDINYGWPISSYGEHYGNIEIENAPLYKSHSVYGFYEPIYFFNPSIGISAIDITKDSNVYALASLNNRSLFKIAFNSDLTKPEKLKKYPVRERIRDIIYIKNINLHILSFEDTPYIGVFINN
tara:strand:+ start:691 stop:2178 length:1488 start_codon:yes stop_codon:yes gene_type:complete